MEKILQILISNALLAMIPAALALIGARYFRRPALVHALWLLALLKLLTPPIFDVTLKILPARHVDEEVGQSSESTPIDASSMHSNSSQPYDDAREKSKTPSLAGGSHDFSIHWSTIALSIWALGALFVLCLTFIRLRRFNRLLQLAELPPQALQAQADQVAAALQIAHCPKVLLIPGAISPMLWAGTAHPQLLLPTDLWRQLSDAQRAALLAHELAHYKRRDHWVRYLELAACVLYWWHPLLWLSRRGLRAAEEECCDAWVLDALPDQRRAYATALLDTVDFVSESHAALPLASGAGGSKNLKRRLIMIMNAGNSKSLSSLGRIFVLGLGLILLPALPKLATADDRDQPKPREEGRYSARSSRDDTSRDLRSDSRDATAREGDTRDGRARDDRRDSTIRDAVPRDGDDRGNDLHGRYPRTGSSDLPARGRGDRSGLGDPSIGDIDRDGKLRLTAGRSGAGTFVRIERGTILLSDDENDKDVRVAFDDLTKVIIDGKPGNVRELRAGMVIKATEENGTTTIEAKRPRWLKSLMPARIEEGARGRDTAVGRLLGENGTRPRGETRSNDAFDPRSREGTLSGGERLRLDGETAPSTNDPSMPSGIQRTPGRTDPSSDGEKRRDDLRRGNDPTLGDPETPRDPARSGGR